LRFGSVCIGVTLEMIAVRQRGRRDWRQQTRGRWDGESAGRIVCTPRRAGMIWSI